jgi:chromate transporter
VPTTFQIFKAFFYIGATAFGGGGSAHIQNAVVTRRAWLTQDEFLESLTLSQTLPGPIFSNLAAQIGARLGGVAGGAAATVAVSLPGATLILLLALVYSRIPAGSKLLEGALTGIGAGAVGISLAMLAGIAPSALRSSPAPWLALAAFIANAVLHISVVWVLLVLVPIGYFWHAKGSSRG